MSKHRLQIEITVDDERLSGVDLGTPDEWFAEDLDDAINTSIATIDEIINYECIKEATR